MSISILAYHVRCDLCGTNIHRDDAFTGYTGQPLEYHLCLRCAYEHYRSFSAAAAVEEAQRVIAAHQRRLAGLR
jgi:hypothetical protein